MANVLVQESSLQGIASAIRSKNGTQNTYKPSQMADAITDIPSGGITPTGTVNITTNGTHDVTNYESANVNVPTGTTPTGTKQISITQNGTTTEDVSAYANAEITVNVPSSASAFNSGSYTPSSNTTSWSIDIGGNYNNFIIYASTDSAGKGVRAVRAIICDFSQTASTRLVFTTNNAGGGVTGAYYTTGYITKNGTVINYSNASNYFPAGVEYKWVAW